MDKNFELPPNKDSMRVKDSLISSGENEGSKVKRSEGENQGAVVLAMWHLLCIIASVSFWTLLYELLNRTKSLSVAWFPFSLGIFTYSIVLIMKRRMVGKIQNTKRIRMLKTIINYFVTTLAVYNLKEYHNASDLLPLLSKSGVPISFGVLVSTILGLLVDGDGIDVLEVLGSAFKVYMIILVTVKRVEAYYVGAMFLLLCGGCVCSDHIVRLASPFQEYISTHTGMANLVLFMDDWFLVRWRKMTALLRRA